MSLIVQQLRELAAENPEAVAVTDKHQRLSRVELIGAVQLLVENLRPYRGQVVALLADNQIDWVVTDLACLEAGVTLLPLPALILSHIGLKPTQETAFGGTNPVESFSVIANQLLFIFTALPVISTVT